jgi:hypothetical protein
MAGKKRGKDMAKSNSSKARRQILLAGSAGLLGIVSVLTGWMEKTGIRRGPGMEAERVASRIDLPGDIGSMMRSFAQDPEKVNRFRELTRWRKIRAREVRKV